MIGAPLFFVRSTQRGSLICARLRSPFSVLRSPFRPVLPSTSEYRVKKQKKKRTRTTYRAFIHLAGKHAFRRSPCHARPSGEIPGLPASPPRLSRWGGVLGIVSIELPFDRAKHLRVPISNPPVSTLHGAIIEIILCTT